MRVVLDTNVVVSALVFPSGSVTWLRSSWQSRADIPLASRDTTVELLRVLSYPKFRLTDTDRQELLANYLPWCEVVEVSGSEPVPDCRDPHDLPFLRLASAGRADVLVTGDTDLTSLAPEFPIPILDPSEAKAWLRREGTGPA